MDGWMDGWIDRWIDRCVNGRMKSRGCLGGEGNQNWAKRAEGWRKKRWGQQVY